MTPDGKSARGLRNDKKPAMQRGVAWFSRPIGSFVRGSTAILLPVSRPRLEDSLSKRRRRHSFPTSLDDFCPKPQPGIFEMRLTNLGSGLLVAGAPAARDEILGSWAES